MDNPREKMIKAHREKSTSKYEKKSRFCDSEDYDREYERRIERSKKPYYDIDWDFDLNGVYVEILHFWLMAWHNKFLCKFFIYFSR